MRRFILNCCALGVLFGTSTALSCSVNFGGNPDPNPDHNCEILSADAMFNDYSVAIDHNVGRSCPAPPEPYESFTHVISAYRTDVQWLYEKKWYNIASQNELYITNPQEYNVAFVSDPWQCPAVLEYKDQCTCEQTVQFTPSTNPAYNIAEEVVYLGLGGANAYSGTSGTMRYKIAWGDPF